MNRKDFYFEQLVTQADLDEAYDYAEQADQFLMVDHGYVGICDGLEVTAQAIEDLTVNVAVGRAYDQDGQRCAVDATEVLDLSQDSNAVTTAVSTPGNEKWISVFIAFDRSLSDTRVDGNAVSLQYERAESVQYIVDQGAEAVAGSAAVYTAGATETYALVDGQTLDVVVNGTPIQTVTFSSGDFVDISVATAAEVAAVLTSQVDGVTGGTSASAVTMTTLLTGPGSSVRVVGGDGAGVFVWPITAAVGAGGPTRPALRADAILLTDVLFREGGTRIYDGLASESGVQHALDATRRETVFDYSGALFDIKAGTITDFADAVAQELANHVNSSGVAHPASALSYDNSSSGLLASTVDAAIDELSAGFGEGVRVVTGTVTPFTVPGSATTTAVNIDLNAIIPVNSCAWAKVRVALISAGATTHFAVMQMDQAIDRAGANASYDTGVTPYQETTGSISVNFQSASGGNMRIAVVKSDAGDVDCNIVWYLQYQVIEN